MEAKARASQEGKPVKVYLKFEILTERDEDSV